MSLFQQWNFWVYHCLLEREVFVCQHVCVCVCSCIENERNRQTERERGNKFDAMTTELKLYSALPYGTWSPLALTFEQRYLASICSILYKRAQILFQAVSYMYKCSLLISEMCSSCLAGCLVFHSNHNWLRSLMPPPPSKLYMISGTLKAIQQRRKLQALFLFFR